MSETFSIDPRAAALLLMDFQVGVIDGFAGPDKDATLDRAARLLTAARDSGLRVIHVVVGFRPGHPEVSRRNASFGPMRGSDRFTAGDPGAAIHPAVSPIEGEMVVTKHRVGPFQGTELDLVLRAHDVDTLVLAGIATSGCVLSAVRHAADADYRLVVVEDCCSDRDAELHRVLLGTLFPRQAAVVTMQDVVSAL